MFSRDELKQFEIAQEFFAGQYRQIRYFIGDVRDENRLVPSAPLKGIDAVVHAAAQNRNCQRQEYNPMVYQNQRHGRGKRH